MLLRQLGHGAAAVTFLPRKLCQNLTARADRQGGKNAVELYLLNIFMVNHLVKY